MNATAEDHSKLNEPHIALLTAIYETYRPDAMMRYGGDDQLLKPLSEDVLRKAIERAWNH